MALYSYECPACKFRSARIHTLKNGEKELCPICLNVMKRDLPRLANPRFKGSGFYETDYKKGKKK
jgi:putative FmdB family regulatory protein